MIIKEKTAPPAKVAPFSKTAPGFMVAGPYSCNIFCQSVYFQMAEKIEVSDSFLAISPLVMVRFSKFKVCSTQQNDLYKNSRPVEAY